MANVSLDWEVEGIISPEESVLAMINVIECRSLQTSGTFYQWNGEVSISLSSVLGYTDQSYKEHPW